MIKARKIARIAAKEKQIDERLFEYIYKTKMNLNMDRQNVYHEFSLTKSYDKEWCHNSLSGSFYIINKLCCVDIRNRVVRFRFLHLSQINQTYSPRNWDATPNRRHPKGTPGVTKSKPFILTTFTLFVPSWPHLLHGNVGSVSTPPALGTTNVSKENNFSVSLTPN